MPRFRLYLLSILFGVGGGVLGSLLVLFLVQGLLGSAGSLPSAGQKGASPPPVTEKIVVNEATPFADAVSKILPAVGLVSIEGSANSDRAFTTGTILTSDYLFLTASLQTAGDFSLNFRTWDGQNRSATLVKQSPPLALARFDSQSQLTIASLTDSRQLRIGQKLGLLAVRGNAGGLAPVFNQATVRTLEEDGDFTLNLKQETSLFNGGPIFDEAGNIYGILTVTKDGSTAVINSSRIKDLLFDNN